MTVGAACLALLPCGCGPSNAPATAEPKPATDAGATVPETGADAGTVGQELKLPRLLDLGAHECIPCKEMAPILDELEKEYADIFKTEFVDVWQNPDVGNQHGVRSIPTQIFFDADGKELYRHVGFISKEDILATWEKHGIDVKKQ